ncbi:MAG: DUF4132 domain-containing protein [Pirellulales bacterium]|nr:DUF4132 domain-containing protein [Pirellulales bacterium]
MDKAPKITEFSFSKDDPLAAEHADVAAWGKDAIASFGLKECQYAVDFKKLPSGKKLLDAKPEQARRYVVAAVEQTRHWDLLAHKIYAQASTDEERFEMHYHPDFVQVSSRCCVVSQVVETLTRRKLPFQKEDLLAILQWGISRDWLSQYSVPVAYIIRALDRFSSTTPIDSELREEMKQFASWLRSSKYTNAKRHSMAIEQLCCEDSGQSGDAAPVERKPAPRPAPAGMPKVLDQLKRGLGMLPAYEQPSTTLIGPDQFPLVDDSPLRKEHELLTALFEETTNQLAYYSRDPSTLKAGQALFELDPVAFGKVMIALAERHVHTQLEPIVCRADEAWLAQGTVAMMATILMESEFSLSRDGVVDFFLYLSYMTTRYPFRVKPIEDVTAKLLPMARRELDSKQLSEGERFVLSLFRKSLITSPLLGLATEEVKCLSQWIGDGADFCLVPGEVWSDAINEDFSQMEPVQRRDWSALFEHALKATVARPSEKWLETAAKLVKPIGKARLKEALEKWFPLVAKGRTQKGGPFTGGMHDQGDVINEDNAVCLRGLLWLVQLLPRQEDLMRQITAVGLSAYKKVPGVGPRAIKVGHAAVYALSQMPSADAVGQLAVLKMRVKFIPAQKEIEKAFNKTAESLDLPRDQIEEMGIPTYGLESVGLSSVELGDCRGELIVDGSRAKLKWTNAKGKAVKAVPVEVKKNYTEELKELKQSLKDIQSMLPAQRDRLDSMFLQEKNWPVETWKERYLDHPLVGTIARRMIWCVDCIAATFLDGKPLDIKGKPVKYGKTAEITLWHPVDRDIDEVTSWRQRLEELEITQPFKQAHREVYLLTDAERATNTYSNRFAAHIIRQHQFNALCGARGWKNSLRLLVDDDYLPPTKMLPQWGLRTEFWVEGIGDNFGVDTNDAGVYLLLATDQVRFYRMEAAENYAHAGGGRYSSLAAGPGEDNINEPLPLEQIPPLVFSEIMRDVDLFVGVASVGNDPTWEDGGPEGRYREYWQGYSFGDLSESATTRKHVLERLVPRLKIADRCSFSDRFLVVQGERRKYKIHLGSGNILMEPNDQYLCIVPNSSAMAKQDDLFLPFEGDRMLSIIISEALLLADDMNIKDATINRQIGI